MPSSTLAEDLKREITSLAERKRSWVELGLFIRKVENNRSWTASSPTFTDWLGELAAIQ